MKKEIALADIRTYPGSYQIQLVIAPEDSWKDANPEEGRFVPVAEGTVVEDGSEGSSYTDLESYIITIPFEKEPEDISSGLIGHIGRSVYPGDLAGPLFPVNDIKKAAVIPESLLKAAGINERELFGVASMDIDRRVSEQDALLVRTMYKV